MARTLGMGKGGDGIAHAHTAFHNVTSRSRKDDCGADSKEPYAAAPHYASLFSTWLERNRPHHGDRVAFGTTILLGFGPEMAEVAVMQLSYPCKVGDCFNVLFAF